MLPGARRQLASHDDARSYCGNLQFAALWADVVHTLHIRSLCPPSSQAHTTLTLWLALLVDGRLQRCIRSKRTLEILLPGSRHGCGFRGGCDILIGTPYARGGSAEHGTDNDDTDFGVVVGRVATTGDEIHVTWLLQHNQTGAGGMTSYGAFKEIFPRFRLLARLVDVGQPREGVVWCSRAEMLLRKSYPSLPIPGQAGRFSTQLHPDVVGRIGIIMQSAAGAFQSGRACRPSVMRPEAAVRSVRQASLVTGRALRSPLELAVEYLKTGSPETLATFATHMSQDRLSSICNQCLTCVMGCAGRSVGLCRRCTSCERCAQAITWHASPPPTRLASRNMTCLQ